MEYDINKEYCKIIQEKLNINEFENALDNAEKLKKYSPSYSLGYYYCGICHYALGDLEASVNNYEKCIELDHSFAKAYFNLGVTIYYLNKYKEALNYVQYAYKIFTKEGDKEACARCVDAMDYIKEEHGL